jgi:Uma2 family endonuclease
MNNTAENKLYTYADYKDYSEGESIEIIYGHVYNMSPAPSRIHQEIISKLITILNNYIAATNGPCKVYPAPFDVFLTDDSKSLDDCKNIVQPDISVIWDKNKLNDKGCVALQI